MNSNSKKSIIEKLNLNKYSIKLVLDKPDDISEFDELAYDTAISKEKYDLIFTFIFSLEDFKKHLQLVIEKQLLPDKGYLYFAYPKKNNPQYAEYIERDSFFNMGLVDKDGYVQGSDIKFARMVSLNDVFTVIGLKWEGKKPSKSASSKKSQCVDDYIDHVADIQKYLEGSGELAFYNSLTPGYQKDWARYVYSAKKQETQDKRLVEMKSILAEGYKSIDLYRRKEK
ncbi:YdeI/OmpD-associated family protein [Paenibacillus apiarius]|uniref:YdeI/OmpD-associated family protein n=1 Tax=Paenibacillus apiarius TaxID=46240 RepID=UPI00197DD55B|nr:YdeI/OmpD-associated family protein [Paenibacillus apiarius]MBN3522370.1 YdeI/OmpD-associated family protein [Paenibacillus apiarius]